VYGKDIQKEFIFENNDLKVLVGKESLEQTYGTIMSTMSRSIPEFPSIGVPDYLFGTNQNVIQYPVLFRSLMSMFQTDKRFISFEIIDIKKDKETITIETQTKTIMGDTFTNNVVL
jgi:hypothetical protein